MSNDMEDGIYFNLDAEKYHALERLSASGICNMLISPANFWASSWLNPDREEDDPDTDARILGRAYHMARFEPHLLDQNFVCKIDADDYKEILTTSTQIADALAELGEAKSKSGEKVLDKAMRLKAAGYSKPILHILEDDWEKARGERQGIAAKYWKQLKRDIEVINSQPEISKHLTGGFSEVSVLWTDEKTGIKMKCRFDYLKPDSWTDYKTFDNSSRKNLEQCIYDAFRYNRYYVQAWLYWHVTELIRAGKIEGTGGLAWSGGQTHLIEQIRTRKSPLETWYVFQEKKGIPNLLARQVQLLTPPHESHHVNTAGASRETIEEVSQKTRRPTALGALAESSIASAKSIFNWYMETCGTKKPWGPLNPTGDINDDCFPPYWLEGE